MKLKTKILTIGAGIFLIAGVTTAGFAVKSTSGGLVAWYPMDAQNIKLSTTEVVSNGTFETGNPPTGWVAPDSSITQVTDARPGSSGTKSIEVTATANYGRCAQVISAEVGVTYKLSGWIKKISGTGTGKIFAYKNADPWTSFTTLSSNSTSWTYVENYIQIDPAVTDIVLGGQNSDNGSVFRYDDISLRKITDVLDTTANGNNGTVTKVNLTTDKNGQANKAASFDGTSSMITTASNITFADTKPWTVSWWANPTTGDWNYITNDTTGDFGKNTIIMHDTSAIFIYDTNGTQHFSYTNSSFLNTWSLYTVTMDASRNCLVYRDGKLIGTPFAAFASSAITIRRIGNRNGADGFQGSMADFRVYNKALSAADVSKLYNEYRAKTVIGSKDKGLVGSWPLDSQNEKVGADVMSGYDFTNGWLAAGTNVAIVNANTFSTAGFGGGVYKTIGMTAGKRYKINIRGTSPSGAYWWIYSGTAGNGDYGGQSSGTTLSDNNYLTYPAIAGSGDFYFKANISTGNWVFNTFQIKPVLAGDATPYGNDGTIFGTSYTTDKNGQSNKAISFNGTSDYINLDGVVNTVKTNTQGTWTAWIKPTDGQPAAANMIMAAGDNNGASDLSLSVETSGNIRVINEKAGTFQFVLDTAVGTMPDGTTSWTHIALVQDGVTPIIYVNGVAPTQTFTIGTNKTSWFSDLTALDTFRIGDINYLSGGEQYRFTGSLSDVRIYNRALSATEVSSLYASYRPKMVASASSKGLVGEWTLKSKDSKSSVLIGDSTPYANDLTISGVTVGTASSSWDGTNDTANSSISNDFSQSYSFNFWLNPARYGDPNSNCGTKPAMVFGKHQSTYYGLKLSLLGNAQLYYTHYDSGNNLQSVIYTTTGLNEWSNYTIVYNSATPAIYFYKNGVLVDSDTSIALPLQNPSETFRIGFGDNNCSQSFYQGSIANFKVYNRALSNAEVLTLYKKGL